MKSKDKEVQALYEAMILGDDEARTELWMSMADQVDKLVANMERKQLLQIDTEDARQEGMLAVGNYLDLFDPSKGSFSSYMWSACRGAILQANKADISKGTSKERQDVTFSDVDDEEFESDYDLERIVLGDEVWAIAEGLLTHTELNVISLRYIEGDSYREAGYKLNMPYKTVEYTEKRALDKIRYAISV